MKAHQYEAEERWMWRWVVFAGASVAVGGVGLLCDWPFVMIASGVLALACLGFALRSLIRRNRYFDEAVREIKGNTYDPRELLK